MVSKASEDFPGAGQAGEDDHGVTRQVEVDVAEVVLTGALDHQPGKIRTRRLGGAQGDDGGGGNSGFFSYGFRHPLMLVENFFEYKRGCAMPRRYSAS